ncbi:MAG: hypothetical protein ACPGVO_12800 [Spirulinaceae cyanobacterium]
MAKKDRKKSKSSSGIGFSVSDTKTVLRKCENNLKKSLNKRSLKFVEESRNSEKYIFSLLASDSTGSFTVDDRGNRYHIVPLLAVGADTYWLNLSLTFLTKSNQSKQGIAQKEFQFSGTSIRIFKGLATEYKKKLLFRAEWDSLKKDNNHAQPHWHVYKSFQARDLGSEMADFESLIESNKVQDFGEFIADFNVSEKGEEFLSEDAELTDPKDQQNTPTEDEWDSATKFHFAMASQWHISGGTHRVVPDQEALLYSWLTGCIQYIKEQLLYVSGRR